MLGECTMKRNWILIGLTLILLIALVAGCSSNSKDNNSGNNVSNSTDEPSVNENREVYNVRIPLATYNKASMNQFVQRFNDTHEFVQIEPMWGADQIQLIAANQAPDIISTGDLHINNHKDILIDLNPYIEKSDQGAMMADFFPGLIEPLQMDGKQLALPRSFNVGLLYYNKDLFDAEGIPYPTSEWTQADFIEAGQSLTKQENNRVTQWGSSTVFGWWGEWLIHVRQAGGDFMVGDTVTLDTPEVVNGLQFFLDKTLIGKYKFAPGPQDDALGGFAGQRTAMVYGGHTGNWLAFNEIADFNWDIAVLPKGLVQADGGELAMEGYGISNTSKNPDAVWEVLQYFVSEEGQKLHLDLGITPVRKSIAEISLEVPFEERSKPQNLEALFESIEKGMTLPRNPEFINTAIQVVQPYIDRMLEGSITPEEAARESGIKAQEYINQMK
jgi:multiple sugar transport system substrate-binding protein